jgi:hypothetical protein
VTLESLAVYWNTDAKSLAGMHHEEAAEVFTDLVTKCLYKNIPIHLSWLLDSYFY